ncbi:MAG TPA: NAD-dependent epimerase/dehydratase family protein [Candidatus Acidoferrum sp.]|nr:NAD-dependent epimerase/dehydratase family protein [Candidatus Acidoferrum sp.]
MILVTGASGHLGTRLVDELERRHEEVRVLLRGESHMPKGVEVVRGDIRDEEAVKKAARGAETIFHLAAVVDYHPAPRKEIYGVNVLGTMNLLKHSEAERFVYQSSTAVYGRRHANPANELTRYRPYSFYGETKVMAERLVIKEDGIVVRSPVIYGPGFNEGFYFMMAQIQRGKMPIIGDGTNQMQWIYVDDLVNGLILAREKGKGGQAYLLAGSEVKTQEEMAAMTARFLGVPPPATHVSARSAYALAYYKMLSARLSGKRPKVEAEHIRKITANRTFDTSKARRELGFEPKTTYEKGMREMVEEFKHSRAARP